jgi:hypothetical protein
MNPQIRAAVEAAGCDTALDNPKPPQFEAAGSPNSVLVVGSNLLSSRTADHSGLECSRWSNMSRHGAPAGTLTASGGSLASGIGAGAQGACAWLTVANGSSIASGSAQASVLPSCSIC